MYTKILMTSKEKREAKQKALHERNERIRTRLKEIESEGFGKTDAAMIVANEFCLSFVQVYKIKSSTI